MNTEELREKKFKEIEEKIGGDLGKKVSGALRDFYTLYTPGMVEWLARLYDPKIGGFYYSNNARDLDSLVYQGVEYKLLPDVESTQQALRVISDSGLAGEPGAPYTDVIPEWMRADIGRYVKGLQNENGFFYNPQWGVEFTDTRISRRARDLMWSCDILAKLGLSPTYDTPTGIKGDGIDKDGRPVASSCKVDDTSSSGEEKSTAEIPAHLENREAFLKYLDGLYESTSSWGYGNTLTAQKGQIVYRDKQLAAEGKAANMMFTVIEWLNSKQRANGLWEDEVNYDAVNGLMKISGVYSTAGVLVPNAERATLAAVEAISTKEEPTSVCCIYNSWYAVARMLNIIRNHGGNEGERIVNAIRHSLWENAERDLKITREKLSVFKKPDGSFSYSPLYSSARSQSCPVTPDRSVEGDMNASCICSSDIVSYILSSLGIGDLTPPIFGLDDTERMLEIFEKSRNK